MSECPGVQRTMKLTKALIGLLSDGRQPPRSGVPEPRIVAFDYGYQMPSHVRAGLVRVIESALRHTSAGLDR